MNLVMIYGPPAVGKLTTAQMLAAMTGYKLFHNHYTQDMVYPIFGHKSPSADNLLREIRLAVFEEAMKSNIDLIFTFCFENPQHMDFLKQTIGKSAQFDSRLLFVRLYCDFDEECKRVEDPSRKNYPAKCQTVEVLKWALKDKNIDGRIDFVGEHLEIDSTAMSPEEVVEKIILYYGLPSNPTDTEFKYL